MKLLQWFLMFPYMWQGLISSLFTLGLVWLLLRFFNLRREVSLVWPYYLPFLVPLLLPIKSMGRLHWGFWGLFSMFWNQGKSSNSLFMVGMLICLLPLLVTLVHGSLSYLPYRRFIKSCRQMTENEAVELFAILKVLAQKAKIALPDVYIAPADRGVQLFVCGTWKRRLIISPQLLEVLPSGELQAILAHEIAHLARHDQIISWLLTLLRSLLFYNPALYYLEKRLKQKREKAADALASSWIEKPKILASGLLHVTKLALKENRVFQGRYFPIVGLTSGDFLTERVQLLMAAKGPNRYFGVRFLFFVILFLGIEILFSLYLLLPLCQHIPCGLMLIH
jgi:beta-lactamase regulating signal transducer with metallopeptidase domain